jgi:hypothetical protein
VPAGATIIAPGKKTFELSNPKTAASEASPEVSFTVSPPLEPSSRRVFVCFFAPAEGSGVSLDGLVGEGGKFSFNSRAKGEPFGALQVATKEGTELGPLVVQEIKQASGQTVRVQLNYEFIGKKFPTIGRIEIGLAEMSERTEQALFTIISNVIHVDLK